MKKNLYPGPAEIKINGAKLCPAKGESKGDRTICVCLGSLPSLAPLATVINKSSFHFLLHLTCLRIFRLYLTIHFVREDSLKVFYCSLYLSPYDLHFV